MLVRTYKLSVLFCLVLGFSSQAMAEVFVEDFADPLSGWTSDWLYLNSNLENYYVSSGDVCDPDYRGNNPSGLWLSDDRGCGTLVFASPVQIDILNGFGDLATAFSMDLCSFIADLTVNIYDKDGALDQTTAVTGDCSSPDSANYTNYAFVLANGISRFEFVGSGIEGNTMLDNVTLDTTPLEETAARAAFRVTKDFSDDNPMPVEVTLTCNTGLPLVQSFMITDPGSNGDELPDLNFQGAAAVDVAQPLGFSQVIFVVTSFEPGTMDCTITESPVPAGYAVEYDDGSLSSVNCSYEDVTGGDYECAVTNTLESVAFTVEKIWEYDEEPDVFPLVASVEIFCENFRTTAEGELVNDSDSVVLSGDSPEYTVHPFPNFGEPATRCRAVEANTLSGVESDQGCADWVTLSVGGPAGSCTITNTVFFEGIPALDRYGLAVLILLTLAVGVVGFRRLA